MIYAVYVTHTKPPLTLRWEDKQVVLDDVADTSIPAKLLYPKAEEEYKHERAKEVFEEIQAHYEERKAAET